MRKLAVVCMLAALLVAAKSSDDKTHKVVMKNLKYDPPKLTIKPGETVVWLNQDDNDHTVISDDKDKNDKELFNSDNIASGEKFSFTFKDKGSFPYHCKYHPRMKGVVIVTD